MKAQLSVGSTKRFALSLPVISFHNLIFIGFQQRKIKAVQYLEGIVPRGTRYSKSAFCRQSRIVGRMRQPCRRQAHKKADKIRAESYSRAEKSKAAKGIEAYVPCGTWNAGQALCRKNRLRTGGTTIYFFRLGSSRSSWKSARASGIAKQISRLLSWAR